MGVTQIKEWLKLSQNWLDIGEEGQVVKKEYYHEILRWFHDAVRRKRLDLWMVKNSQF